MLSTPADVVRALRALGDGAPLRSGSVLSISSGPSDRWGDPWRRGFLTAMEVRSELEQRLGRLDERERALALLWFTGDRPAGEVAERLGVSRATAYRMRDRVLESLCVPSDPAAATA